MLNKKGSISAWDSSGLWANTDFFPTDQAPGIMDTDYVNKNMIYFGGIIQSFQPFIAVYYNPQWSYSWFTSLSVGGGLGLAASQGTRFQMWSMQKQQWQNLRRVHKSSRYCEFIAYQIRYSLSKVQKLTINLTVASLNLFITYRGSLVSRFCLSHKVYSQQEVIKSRLSSYCREKNQDLYALVAVRWDILYLISVGAVIAFSSFMNRSCDSTLASHTPNQFVTANLAVTEIRYFLP